MNNVNDNIDEVVWRSVHRELDIEIGSDWNNKPTTQANHMRNHINNETHQRIDSVVVRDIKKEFND